MNRRDALKAIGVGLGAALLPSWLVRAYRPVDLAPFCAREEHRTYSVLQPFEQCDWLYATDGKVIVRVRPEGADRREGERELPPAGNLAWDHDARRGWRPWPRLTPTPVEGWCPDCYLDYPPPGVPCPTCGDRGGWGPFASVAEVGGQYVDGAYYRKVLALPGVEFVAQADEEKPIPFRFDGGTGLLMSLRREATLRRIQGVRW